VNATSWTVPGATLGKKHLLGIEDLSLADAQTVLQAARALRPLTRAPAAKESTLRGRTVINLFFEASTRTRTSFELAGKRLGADVVNISASGSSVSKGETLLDTVRNVEAMRADVIVIRHEASGAPAFVARALDQAGAACAVVNAGDGLHEHPTQALLDAFTIADAKARPDFDFRGLTVAIAGDVLHSRVARSNARLLTMLGATVRLAAPWTLMPRAPEVLRNADALGALETHSSLDAAVEGADVVMMLRVQRERLGAAFFASTREYARTFGLSAARLARAKADVVVMHPGPINRGVEISDEVADAPYSVVLDQVESGLAVRMAVLHLLGVARA
jgi:aspartate carbamoyltransferase catalytic subunit